MESMSRPGRAPRPSLVLIVTLACLAGLVSIPTAVMAPCHATVIHCVDTPIEPNTSFRSGETVNTASTSLESGVMEDGMLATEEGTEGSVEVEAYASTNDEESSSNEEATSATVASLLRQALSTSRQAGHAAGPNDTIHVTITLSEPNETIDWSGNTTRSFDLPRSQSAPHSESFPFQVESGTEGDTVVITVTVQADNATASGQIGFYVRDLSDQSSTGLTDGSDSDTALPGPGLIGVTIAVAVAMAGTWALRRRR